MANIDDLRTLAQKIKNETNVGANTAERVGTTFEKLVTELETIEGNVEDIITEQENIEGKVTDLSGVVSRSGVPISSASLEDRIASNDAADKKHHSIRFGRVTDDAITVVGYGITGSIMGTYLNVLWSTAHHRFVAYDSSSDKYYSEWAGPYVPSSSDYTSVASSRPEEQSTPHYDKVYIDNAGGVYAYSPSKRSLETLATAVADEATARQQADEELQEQIDNIHVTVDVDDVPTKDSDNPVSSGGVYDAIEEVNTQIDDTAHGNMITSEYTEPIIQSTTRGDKWNKSGLNYNDSAEFRGLECWGVRIVGVSGDVEIGKINVTTKSTSSIVTVSASEMTEGTFYDVLFDVQILNSDEVLYLRGKVYWTNFSGVNCVLADNKVFPNALAWIVPLVKVYEKINILDEIQKLSNGKLGENKGTDDNYIGNWYGFDTLRVTQNAIITQFRYRLVSTASYLQIKVVTLDANNIVTAVRDYSFNKITNSESVSAQIPVTPNDIVLCKGVSVTGDDESSRIVWMQNVEIGAELTYNNNKYSIALEWDWVADTEVNRTVFASAEKIEFPNKKLKLAVLGDSIMATTKGSGTGRDINAKLGTTLLKTTNNLDYGVFAVGWATLVDWVKNGVNSSTPKVNIPTGPEATNCITNQVRRLLQHTTALGQQITWTHPTEGDTYTIDTSVATGEGYTDDIPDIIFIAAGTNDWNAGDVSYDKYTKFNAETGTDDYDTVIGQSYSELDRGTFSSCIRWIIETLKINYPNSHIIFGNIMHATSRTNWTTAKQRSKLIEDICGWEGIPVIDTLHKSGLGGGTLGWLTNEGLHPNATGRDLLASFIASQIKSLVGELR